MRSVFVLSLTLLAACGTCPMGTVKEAGQCVPDASDGTIDDPVSEENFQRKFNIRRCQAADQCLVDQGYDPDYWDVICDEPTEWDDDCPFVLSAAEQCLDADWGCGSGPGIIYTDPAAICDDVYDCGR